MFVCIGIVRQTARLIFALVNCCRIHLGLSTNTGHSFNSQPGERRRRHGIKEL